MKSHEALAIFLECESFSQLFKGSSEAWKKKGDSPDWSPCWLSMLPTPHAHSFLMKQACNLTT
ncbi:hypothetical protein I79_010499 [Cricetulus griseus]|uniref:Uncharacterized protein n=1 Tax=Cricetulus griseus TaxID=10029 RepID=G3HIM5_CRIGR|nr:hypothetical protein I79_010499 [Cricetulus griseus]